jgi:hypothetical protein
MPADEPLCPEGALVSDPRQPDDGSSWPERDLDRTEEPASGWSDDDPYRYEPPPRWEPQPFEPPPNEPSPWHPPSFDDDDDEGDELAAADQPADDDELPFRAPPPPAEAGDEPSEAEAEAPRVEPEPAPWSAEPEVQPEPEPSEPEPEEQAAVQPDEAPYAEPFFQPISRPAFEPDGTEDIEEAQPEPVVEQADEEPEGLDQPMEAEPVIVPAIEVEPAEDREEAEVEEPAAHERQAEDQASAEDEAEEAAYVAEPVEELEPEIVSIPTAAGLPAGAEREAEPEPEPWPAVAPEPPDRIPGEAWDLKLDGNRRRATTAEQAVPWLIGIILALAGIVIVLLALIFTSPGGLVAGQESPTATSTPSAEASVQPSPSGLVGGGQVPTPTPEPSATPEATPTPELPAYGALEMVYLGRPSGVAPIYLLRRDFSKRKEAVVMAQADQGVEKFAWAPDGTVGLAVISGRAIALTPGKEPRPLADNVSAATFGWDASTIYAVRTITQGGNDRTRIVEIDFDTGDLKLVATIRYPHPVTAPDPPLREAQFIDDGGQVRIFAVADGRLTLWVLGAPDTYQIDPANGAVTKIARQPTLWSPDGTKHVTLNENGGQTTIRVRGRSGGEEPATKVTGLVSHVRWAGGSNEIVYTLGVLSVSGGVRQDLYVWDLNPRHDPLPLTSSGAAFGAEWRGVMQNWLP